MNASKITPQFKFKDDLDLDSLDAVEVVMALEEEFCIEIPDSEADKIFSIPDAVGYITWHKVWRSNQSMAMYEYLFNVHLLNIV